MTFKLFFIFLKVQKKIAWKHDILGAIEYESILVSAEGEITELISSFANATFSELEMGSYYNFSVKSVGKEGRSNEIYSEVFSTQTGSLLLIAII